MFSVNTSWTLLSQHKIGRTAVGTILGMWHKWLEVLLQELVIPICFFSLWVVWQSNVYQALLFCKVYRHLQCVDCCNSKFLVNLEWDLTRKLLNDSKIFWTFWSNVFLLCHGFLFNLFLSEFYVLRCMSYVAYDAFIGQVWCRLC